MQTIAGILAHESLETTRIFTRPKGKDKAAALELLAWLIGPIGPVLRLLASPQHLAASRDLRARYGYTTP